MPTVTGTVKGAVNFEQIAASLDVAVCGYGSSVPRVDNNCLIGKATETDIAVDPATGDFSFTIPGNDQIVPAGTYYTVTVRDENGDIIQVNAYQFLSTTSNYDLDVTNPYDPNLPPPPLPVPITNELEIMTPAANMVFDGTYYTTFKTTLPGNINDATTQNMIPGNLYTFIFVQDATGGHVFLWASGVHNWAAICPIANSTTIQTFVADDLGELYAIAPGTVQL